MLELYVPRSEWFNNDTQTFELQSPEFTLILEHSLVSLSKWESKWKKPFLEDQENRTPEEFIDYIRCMTINRGIDPRYYYNLTTSMIARIRNYIDDPMTATKIRRSANAGRRGGKRIITSEIIYSWMVQYGIPFECQKWHLNRLMMLIEVCALSGDSPKKMSKGEIMKENAALNKMRRAKMRSKG